MKIRGPKALNYNLKGRPFWSRVLSAQFEPLQKATPLWVRTNQALDGSVRQNGNMLSSLEEFARGDFQRSAFVFDTTIVSG
jgi:hypothetical protein